MNKLFDITGNVTVITGGTGVLGRTIAKYLALEGAKVIILGRKEDVGNKIAEDIEKDYPNVMIDTLAYKNTQAPPTKVKPHKNVCVRL